MIFCYAFSFWINFILLLYLCLVLKIFYWNTQDFEVMTNPIDQDVVVKIRERIASFIMTQVINPKGEFQCDNPGLNYNWTKMSIVLWNNNQGPAGYKTCRIRNMMCSSVYVLSLILYKMMMMNMMCCSCTMYDDDDVYLC